LVSLDDAVIARLKKGEEHFEILVDPYAAADLIDGNEIEINQCLAIDSIFKDAKMGTHASEESLKKNFNTENIEEIAKQIILKGDIQLTTEQRHKMKENKKNRIVEKIVKNAMDPKTKTPHPRQRIELAMEEAGVNIDPFKPVRDQVKTIIDLLKPLIPLSSRNYGVLEREDWQSDGSWLGIVKIPAGMQNDFYDKLNDMTKGNVSTKILK